MESHHSNTESYAKYVARGAEITIVSMTATAVAGLAIRMIMARSLPVHEYGLFFAVVAFLSFLEIFRDAGAGSALVRYISKFRGEEKIGRAKSVFLSGFMLQAIFTGVLCSITVGLAGWLSSSFFGILEARWILLLMLVWFGATMPMHFFQNTFQGFRDITWARGPEPVRMGLTLAIICSFAYLGFNGIRIMALAFILGAAVSASLSYFVLRKKHPEIMGFPRPNIRDFKMLLSFGTFTVLAGAATMIIQKTDTLMLTALRSLSDVGFYQTAKPLAQAVGWVGLAIAMPLLPLVSELWAKGEKRRLKISLGMLTKFAFIFAIPTALVFVAFPDIVLSLLFGSQYTVASTALRILGVGMIFFVGSSSIAVGIVGIGKPKLDAKIIGVAACFNVAVNYLLIPHFGAGGAAVATSLSFLLILIFRFHYIRKIIEFLVPTADILKVFAMGGISLLAIWILKSLISLTPWLKLFAVIVPCFFLYVFLICRVGILKKEDIETLRKVVPENVVKFIEVLS